MPRTFSDSGRPLGVGISLGRASERFADQLELARRAEAAGFDMVTVGDNGVETFAMMGALAVATERVRLVSSIAGWSHSPATMAHAASTVQNLSSGRFVLGIGATPRAWVRDWHGMEFDPVVPRMREYVIALQACLRASSEAPTAVDGRWFPTHGYANWDVVQSAPPPVLLGVTLPRMTTLAGEVCEGVMINSIVPLEHIRTRSAAQLRDGLAAAGRAPEDRTVGVGRFVGVHPDRSRAYDLVRAQLGFYFAIPYFRTVLADHGFEAELAAGEAAVAAGDPAAQIAAVSDRMVDAIGLAGTPGEVREKLGAYEGVVDWVVLAGGMNLPPAEGQAHTARILETFGAVTAVG
ncbi:LLM class flavin-dependent oxidoreductase [Pseudonocardia sp. WMMC193]|uniref:LLM class flavin-dependent oxidoreductase n=1 Tax=Pseudonocardia sp. WMMC193 TaxID=2911965 RepID=UPI001F2CDFC6|nr:LLM class flavin-dependent oxidoreductase [Pseudonocardia sp. WMMC193]MCF7550007.1 LLM class flavin-dependent oxidoreductase [Pseudonocardia sp. WMMC193]